MRDAVRRLVVMAAMRIGVGTTSVVGVAKLGGGHRFAIMGRNLTEAPRPTPP